MTLPKLSTYLFLALFLVIQACNDSPKQKGCKYGTPVAIFKDIPGLQGHDFQQTGQDAVERIEVPDLSMTIEVFQSGCNALQQEFRFLLNGTYQLNTPPAVCAIDIASIFNSLAEKAPERLALLQQWAGAIQTDASNFQYNEPLMLQGSNVKAQIDKSHQADAAILSITFSQ